MGFYSLPEVLTLAQPIHGCSDAMFCLELHVFFCLSTFKRAKEIYDLGRRLRNQLLNVASLNLLAGDAVVIRGGSVNSG